MTNNATETAIEFIQNKETISVAKWPPMQVGLCWSWKLKLSKCKTLTKYLLTS